MAEIMLAPVSGEFTHIHNMSNEILPELFGVKVMVDETYTSDTGSSFDYQQALLLAKAQNATHTMLDTRFAFDTIEETKKALEHVLKPRVTDKGKQLPPVRTNFMTINYSVPDEVIEEFVRETKVVRGIVPVIVVPTSRYKESFFIRVRSAEELVSETAKLCSRVGAAIMCGCVDAEFAYRVDPNIQIFGLGGRLSPEEPTSHHRPGLVEDTKDYVDVFVDGSPIFDAGNPTEAVLIRKNASY